MLLPSFLLRPLSRSTMVILLVPLLRMSPASTENVFPTVNLPMCYPHIQTSYTTSDLLQSVKRLHRSFGRHMRARRVGTGHDP